MRALPPPDTAGRSVRATTALFQPACSGCTAAGFCSLSPASCCRVVVLLCSSSAAMCLQSNPIGQVQMPLVGLPVAAEMRARQLYGNGPDPTTVPESCRVAGSQSTDTTAPPRE